MKILIALLLPAVSAAVGIVLQDRQFFTSGNYSAYASPWSSQLDSGLAHGRDYLDTIMIDPAAFPDRTVIQTRWPKTPPKQSGVWGYHAISFGNYDSGIPERPVPPRQVKAISRLAEEFSFTYDGSSNFNLLNEFYLTLVPGNAKTKVLEIGFLLHAPESSMRFIRSGTPIGIFDYGGHRWLVTRTGNYVTIVRKNGADLANGRIDLLHVLTWLVRRRVITGDEWFNGIAFGTEPTEGAGRTRLRIAHWRVDYF